MSTEIATRPTDPAVVYRDRVTALATEYLATLMGSEAAKEAAGRLALALRAAALKNPDLYDVHPRFVAYAIALCGMTGLMPGGPFPEVELIPRWMTLEDEQRTRIRTLDWQVTSRGYAKMAERAGWTLEAVPVFEGDVFRAPRGLHSDVVHEPDYSQEPDYQRLQLFYVLATRPGYATAWRVIHRNQIEQRRKKAQTDKIWREWPLEMAAKTAIAYAVRRGIVPLDPVHELALEQPTRADVIAAEDLAPVMAESVARETPTTARGKLLQAVEDLDETDVYITPEPEPVRREPAQPAQRALSAGRPQEPVKAPKPAPTPKAEPLPQREQEPPTAESPTARALADAEVLRQVLTEQMTDADLRSAFRARAGLARVSEGRWQMGFRAAIRAGYVRKAGDGVWAPAGVVVDEAPVAAAEVEEADDLIRTPETWHGPDAAELVTLVAEAEQALGEIATDSRDRIQRARRRAQCSDPAAGDQDALRRYSIALEDELEDLGMEE